VYQIFGKDTLDSLLSIAAVLPFDRMGLPQPPPWRREADGGTRQNLANCDCTVLLQSPSCRSLNRNSIYILPMGG